MPRKSTNSARIPLTRERALAAAVTIADTEGIGALTMRRLAKELGVEAMSLYYHVANKDDLLDGMVDRVFAEVELPTTTVDWRTAMRQRATSQRAAMLRHPWSISVLESRSSPGPATLRHHDAVLGCCRAAGFSIEMSAHAFSLIDSFIYGFVLQEISLPFDDSNVSNTVAEMAEFVPADDYPHLSELTVEHVMQVGYNFSDEFDFGLEIVLAGLEAAAANDSPAYGQPSGLVDGSPGSSQP